ncbi:uncharacterized protein [Euwallacea similis]|uniref:uncharacterized protein n=1 Tax=Euwallacea similis TaxID=1736056 RepID=UPI00344CBA14
MLWYVCMRYGRLEGLKTEFYWPRRGQTFKKYIKNSSETWHIDHAGPLVKSDQCTHIILVIVDAYSKYNIFCLIRNKKLEYTILALGKVFQKFGKPKMIIVDREFVSTKFKEFLAKNKVDLHLIATGMPRGNDQVEWTVRMLFNLMRSILTDKKEAKWTSVIPQIEAMLNEIKTEKDLLEDVVEQKTKDLLIVRAKANHRMEINRKEQEVRFNVKRFAAKLYQIGDKVVVANTQVPGGKFKPKFDGPYEIHTSRYEDGQKVAKLKEMLVDISIVEIVSLCLLMHFKRLIFNLFTLHALRSVYYIVYLIRLFVTYIKVKFDF